MAEFSKIIDSCIINEQNSINILDDILIYWTTRYKIIKNKDKRTIPTVKLFSREISFSGFLILI